MKASKRAIVFLVTGVLAALCGAFPDQLAAQTAATEPSSVTINGWAVFQNTGCSPIQIPRADSSFGSQCLHWIDS